MMASEVLSSSFDIPTELLIAQLLEEDLANIGHGKVAERMQLNLMLFDNPDVTQPHPQKVDPDTDEDVAARMFVENARVTGDAAYAHSLHNSFDAASYQLAQKLHAAEKKIMLDAEFAKRLQAAEDSGEVDTDAPEMQDVDRCVAERPSSSMLRPWPFCVSSGYLVQISSAVYWYVAAVVDYGALESRYHFQAQDMNDKGKGKVTAAASSSNTTVFDAFSPVPAVSKKLEMLSEGKGKSKEQDEPLPGRFRSVLPQHPLDRFVPPQSIPDLTRTQCAASALNRSRPRTPPSRPP